MKHGAVVLIATLLAACGSSPPVQFFTLAPQAGGTPAKDAATAAYSVVVGPVTVPDMVDRPQLVLRTAPHRVELAELARWAEPLNEAIPRMIAADLQTRLADARVSASTPALAAAADHRVAIAIEKFEAAPGDAAIVDAVWTITSREGTRSGRSHAREPAGRGYDEVVAAYSRALARVAADIAAGVRAVRSTPPAPR